jgi:hypothetical protein
LKIVLALVPVLIGWGAGEKLLKIAPVPVGWGAGDKLLKIVPVPVGWVGRRRKTFENRTGTCRVGRRSRTFLLLAVLVSCKEAELATY